MSQENVQAVMSANPSDLHSLLSNLGADSFTGTELHEIANKIYGLNFNGNKEVLFDKLLNQSYQINYAQSLVDTYDRNNIQSF